MSLAYLIQLHAAIRQSMKALKERIYSSLQANRKYNISRWAAFRYFAYRESGRAVFMFIYSKQQYR
jgi:hypothetical protein